MPLKTRVKASTSTHEGNGGDVTIPKSDSDLINNMGPSDMLIDPEDMTSGSTHTSVTAKRKTKASEETTNISTMEFDTEPAKGYIENADFADDDELNEEEVEEDLQASIDPELENNMDSQSTLTEAGDDDWDAEPEDAIDNLDSDIEESDEAAEEDEVEEPQPEEVNSEEDMPLLDIDETPDEDVNVAYASFGTRLMVIKSNRIIASMTEKMASKNGRSDVYQTEAFTKVVSSELERLGLRKGLKACGFVLAKVNVAKASVVEARVKKQVYKTEAAVRQVQASKEQAFNQSLAIASLGINRGFFAKQENPLKASLIASLASAGIRNPSRLVNKAFAATGTAYAKSVVELAQKISAMPQEARDGYVDALEMTSEDMDDFDTSGEDTIAIGADDEFTEDLEDDIENPPTMATAGVVRKKQRVISSVSAEANAILNGSQPLFSY